MKQLNQTQHQLNPTQQRAMQFDPISQLELKVNKSDKQDYEQIVKILSTILTYPSTQLADLHMDSDKLGKADLDKKKMTDDKDDKKNAQQLSRMQFCPCCGFVKQQQQIATCTRLKNISNIGISTFLYFETVKNLILLLVVLTLLYSIYALATNLIASGVYAQIVNSNSMITAARSYLSYVSLSLGSKQLNQTDTNKLYYYIQCWIGLAVVIVWLLMFFLLKYFERQNQINIQQQTISAADFAISIENAPKDLQLKQLQQQLNKYYDTLTHIPQHHKKPFELSKINIGKPFYLNQKDFQDDQLDKLKDRREQLIQKFVDLIKQRQDSATFTTVKQERNKMYTQFNQIMQSTYAKYKQLGEKIQAKIKSSSKDDQARTTIFATFKNSRSMRVITRLNDPSILSTIRYYLTCCQGHHKFHLMHQGENMRVKIQRAPQPEDIIWTNLGVPTGQIIKRKIITFTATALLLGASFGIVYGLSKAQQSNKNNQIISLAISVCLSVMNIIIGLFIRALSVYEKDYTMTKYQTSLAIKSILAALINSILIPIIVNFYIKVDVYGQNGLASDVFMLGLTNSLVAPILKIIDISYIINRLTKWWFSKPYKKIYSNQGALNDLFQYMVFEVGYEYVYLVSLFLFTCFFVSLQPIISMFAICGMFLMYWAQKYSLFHKMKRPVPGTDLINVAMFQIILFGGLAYSLGSLTWSNFMPGGIPTYALLPNLIAVGFSVLMLLMPYNTILASCLDDKYSANQIFDDCRLLLPSEYDRLNPDTSQAALKEFQQFYERKVKAIQSGTEADKQKFMDLFAKQGARGHQRPSMSGQPNSPGIQSATLINALLPGGGAAQQAPLPFMNFMPPPPQQQFGGFGAMMMPQQQFGFNMPFMNMQGGFRPQQSGFMAPMQSGFMQPRQPMPGFGFPQQSGFGFQQPPPVYQQPKPVYNPPPQNIMPQNNLTPNNQQGFQQPPPQNQNRGFQPPPPQYNNNQGFGFQAPPPQNQGFGFQAPPPPPQPQQQNQGAFGFKQNNSGGFGFQVPGFKMDFNGNGFGF